MLEIADKFFLVKVAHLLLHCSCKVMQRLVYDFLLPSGTPAGRSGVPPGVTPAFPAGVPDGKSARGALALCVILRIDNGQQDAEDGGCVCLAPSHGRTRQGAEQYLPEKNISSASEKKFLKTHTK